jgi:hypothetical protein
MDADDYRCPVCDGHYCGWGACSGQDGDVWVNGRGWTDPVKAAELEAQGRTVQWTSVWTPDKYA